MITSAPLSRWKVFSLIFLVLLFISGSASRLSTQAPQSRDFYKILGVSRKASTKEIKKRYRELCKEFHPDSNPSKDAAKEFLDIRDANEVLTNAESKKLYDMYGEAGLDPNLQQSGDADPGFRFGGAGGSTTFVFRGNEFQFQGGGGGHPFSPDIYPEGDKELVGRVHGRNWEEKIEQRDWIVLVNFYNPSCKHCVDFKKAYESIAKSFKDLFPVTAVNCEQSRSICERNHVQTLPTILLFGENKSSPPTKYEGIRTESALKNWLDKNIVIPGTVLNEANFEKWLTKEVDKPKVLFVSEKSVVPLLFRGAAKDFRSKISFGSLLLGTKDGQTLREKVLIGWNSNTMPKLPALMYINDVDAVTGEWTSIKSQSYTVLTLVFSRIVAQHRTASSDGNVHELTKRRFLRGDCAEPDGNICFLLLIPGSLASVDPELAGAMVDIATTYSEDALKIFWVNVLQQVEFARGFGFDQYQSGCLVTHTASNCTRFVAYRPKRKKFEVLNMSDEETLSKAIERFVDSIMNGGRVMTQRIPAGFPQIK